jgi:hypothetical protein
VRPRPRSSLLILGLILSAAAAHAAERGGKAEPEYGRDLLSVVTGQHEPFPTGNCIVWANAEGPGVGPAQLGGYHGVTMNIDLKPMGKDSPQPRTFAAGLAELKARYPGAPPWLVMTIEKNQAAIEAACSGDHETPFTIHKIAAADRRG